MARNSKSRLNKEVESTKPADADPVAALGEGALTFTTPTEFVELPSGGDYYPEGHRLHGEQTVEIKFMTAKEEDILTSKTLIKQGVALERLLKSVIVDKSIDPSTMLTGDRNALLIAARKSGYGEEYNAKINCPSCNSVNEIVYNLDEVEAITPSEDEEVKWKSEGNMLVALPLSKLEVEAKLLTGKEEMHLSRMQESKRKKKLLETSMQDVLKSMIVSVNGDNSAEILKLFISRVPARDIKHLREVYKRNTPNVEMNHDFECENCNYGTVLEVPFTVEFFWPR